MGTTLSLTTLRSGVNDDGNSFSSLKVAYADYSIGDVALWDANHSVKSPLTAAQTEPIAPA